MGEADFSYREIAPTAGLEPYILSFWEFAVAPHLSGPVDYEIFPDGCSSLFYFSNAVRGICVIGISGLHIETIKRPVFGGDTFWGMRLSPAACSAILRADPGELLRSSASKTIADFPHLGDGMIGEFAVARKFEEFAAICEKRITKLIATGCVYDPPIADAVAVMAGSPGEIRVDALATSLGLSTRQFQRRFKASSGLSPKQFLRTLRIRASAVGLVEDRNPNWAAHAAELGFADQAHLSHEFVSITHRSPGSFAKSLRDVAHGDLIK